MVDSFVTSRDLRRIVAEEVYEKNQTLRVMSAYVDECMREFAFCTCKNQFVIRLVAK